MNPRDNNDPGKTFTMTWDEIKANFAHWSFTG
jgi:hypothetical protein